MGEKYEIYLLTIPGYWYIGSTARGASHRLSRHLNGSAGADQLHKKIKEVGKNHVSMTVVEKGDYGRYESEQAWYDFYFAHDARQTLNGRRPCDWGGGFDGKHHTPETREKMSQAAIGRKNTLEQNAKISQAKQGNKTWLGKTHTPESKVKISIAKKGRILGPQSEIHIQKRKEAAKLVPKLICLNCGMVTTPGPMTLHREASGHRSVQQ